jgi:hypothetical protein
MIELNCSYKESKKILELGYDFSKVCTHWEFRDRRGYYANYTKVGGYLILEDLLKNLDCENSQDSNPRSMLHNYSETLTEVMLDIKDYLCDRDVNPIFPLIPKAALEKCLPLIDGVIWKRFPAAGDGLLRCTGLNHRTVETCTGFHEFLWCHENYPEELKKKFNNEVMA